MTQMQRKKEKLYRAEDANAALFEEISREIYQHPEEGDKEYYCSSMSSSMANAWP